jgi:hypothetical protein
MSYGPTSGATPAYPNGPQNPFGTQPASAIQTLFPGPFSTTNPSTNAWRVVSFQLKMIPTSQVTAKGGDLVVGYHPSVGTAISAGANVPEFSRVNIDNLEWSMPVSGDVAIVINWVPNSAENTLQSSSHIGDAPQSAVLGYFLGAGTTSCSFRVEYDIGIEYVPNVSYRPFVERKVPQGHPDAWYHINKELSENWDRWVIMPYSTYLMEVKSHESLNPGFTTVARLNGMGSYGYGGVVGDGEAEEGPGLLGKIGQYGKMLGGVYCSMIDPDNPFCQGKVPESAFEILSDMRSGPRRLQLGQY